MVLRLIHSQAWTETRREKADTYSSLVTNAEHGKPVFSPEKAGQPRGKLMEMRGRDAGKSEGRLVMGRIGFEAQTAINPPERELTSGRSLFAREFVEPSLRRTSK